MSEDKNPELSVRYVKCPQCRQIFELSWESWGDKPRTLIIRDCPSGGIYDVIISCSTCDYEEAL